MVSHYPPEETSFWVYTCWSSTRVMCWTAKKEWSAPTRGLRQRTQGRPCGESPLCPSSPSQSRDWIATDILRADCLKRHQFAREKLGGELANDLLVGDSGLYGRPGRWGWQTRSCFISWEVLSFSSWYSQALFLGEAVHTLQTIGESSGSAGSWEGRGGAYGGR